MKKSFRVIIVFWACFLASGVGFSAPFICDEDREVATDPTTGVFNIRIIYVGFEPALPLTQEVHGEILNRFKWLVFEQSHGKVEISDDSKIVFRQGEGFEEGLIPPMAWEADEGALFYNQWLYTGEPGDPQQYVDYYNLWESRNSSWWYNMAPGFTGALMPEIFWKIRENRTESNPFEAPSGEKIDLTCFIFLGNISPYTHGSVGGRPRLNARLYFMQNGNQGSDYFQDLRQEPQRVYPQGVGQMINTIGPEVITDPQLVVASTFSLSHEFTHRMGPRDGPPNLIASEGMERYFYGYNNLLCQSLPGTDGVPALGLPWLATIPDWHGGLIDFTGQNLKGQTIYDIREFDSGNENAPEGKIFKFRRTGEFEDEYFLIAYHSGMGVDAQPINDPSKKMIKSQGLEIYHCISDQMFDLESAFGLYDDIPSVTLPENIEQLDPSLPSFPWGSPNWEIGRDNYDYWETISGEPRDPEEFADHSGGIFDFFSGDLGSEFSQWEKEDFSFQSNPRCFWYDDHSYDPDYHPIVKRFNPQTAPNSMVVRIREQHNEADPPYAIVDFLTAPYEDILSPGQTENEFYQLGDPIEITWEDHYGDDITKVEISFSTDDGSSFQPIITIDPAVGVHSYSWTPSGTFSEGMIKLLFYNGIVASNTCDETSDFSFSVVGAAVYYRTPDDPIEETGLIYSGTPYSVVEWDFLNAGGENKNLFISISDDFSQLYKGTGINEDGIPIFDETPRLDFTGGAPQAGLRGLSVAPIDDDGQTDLFAAHEDEPRLYKYNQATTRFNNIAIDLGLETNANHSIAGTWGDFNKDGDADLFVSRAPGFVEDPPNYSDPGLATNGSVLLTNYLDEETGERFFITTPSSGIPVNLGSQTASWCDFDGDTDLDLFVGTLHDNGSGASRLYRNINFSFTEVTSLLQSTAITMVTACAWADMNGDQFLDLVLTRHDQPAAIYFNDGVGNFSDGNGGPAPFLLGTSDGFSGLVLYDFDLDRDLDFLGLSNSDLRSPVLFDNHTVSGSTPQFEDITAAVGLDDLGYVHGALALDFGNETGETPLPDLFLGRPTANGKFYFKGEPTSGVSGIANHFVSVRLESDSSTDNSVGIGATVKVTSGSITQNRLVDGGSMRGSQSSRDLIFGLGDYQGSISATVTWSSGIEQTDVPLVMDQLNVISLAEIQVNDSSVVGKYIVQASGLVDWEFKWDVNILGDAQFNEVIFNMASIPTQCQPEEASITLATSSEVELDVSANASGGFTNVLTWRNRPCVPQCNIPFHVKSGNSQQIDTSDSDKILKVKVCVGT